MHSPFPNLPFAIVFVVILVVGLGYAAYVDWKTMKVPKWLTLGLLGTGFVMNATCGGWLGVEGRPMWILDADNALLGAIDGILLSLVGFIVGFGLFFGFWIFGLSGGGDVKLVGATGAWLGCNLLLIGVLLSLPFLVVLTLLVLGYRLAKGKLPKLAATTEVKGRKRTVTTYSLPFALGVYVVLFVWMLR
jgi:Flp pilus assembly protein protease CpaA